VFQALRPTRGWNVSEATSIASLQIATTAVSTETAPALMRKTCKSQLQRVPQTAFGLPVMGVFHKSCEFRACGRMPWRLPEAARGPSLWTELGAGRLHQDSCVRY